MRVVLGTILFLDAANGVSLKLAFWLYNYWFAATRPVLDKNSPASPVISTTRKVENYPAPRVEQANSSSPPHEVPTLTTASKGPRVVVPTFIGAIAYGFLLFGLQVVLSVIGYGLMQIMNDCYGYLFVVIGVFTATAGLISVMLSNSFIHSLIVTGIFYGLVLLATSPITITLFLLTQGRGYGSF